MQGCGPRRTDVTGIAGLKSSTKSPRPLRYLVPIAATGLVLLILLAATVPLMHWVAESGREAQFAASFAVWREHGISNYDLTLEQRCDCPPAGNRIIEVAVRNEQVASVRGDDGYYSDAVEPLLTVPQIFAAVEEGILIDPDAMSVRYDENYGFPREVSIDPSRSMDADELDLTVRTFRPLAR